jgi:hypothetical protein
MWFEVRQNQWMHAIFQRENQPESVPLANRPRAVRAPLRTL